MAKSVDTFTKSLKTHLFRKVFSSIFAILPQCSISCIGFLSHFINFKILLLTFKAIHELALSYINDLVKINFLNSRDKLRSNDGILLSHPNFKTSTTLGDRAFVASALKLWNDLLLEIRMAKSVDTFTKSLKTHLFRKVFHS